MYKVSLYHHRKEIRRGDLEDKLELLSTEIFKSRKSAKEWIENRLSKESQKQVTRKYRKGDEKSYCFYKTGITWIHENTGEKQEEYYMYVLEKKV